MNSPRVGIGVLIFNNKFLLLGKRMLKHGSSSWAPPGGHLEFGETFEECAIREVKEETGLEITSPRIIGVTNDLFLQDNKHYVSIFLHVKYDGNQQIQNLEPEKVLSWNWFDVSQIPDNLFLPLQNLIKNKSTLLSEFSAL
jgi:8-oxo-dGTP diphosphatase